MVSQQGACRKVALTPVDISVDNGGEAGAVPVDALGDTAAPKGFPSGPFTRPGEGSRRSAEPASSLAQAEDLDNLISLENLISGGFTANLVEKVSRDIGVVKRRASDRIYEPSPRTEPHSQASERSSRTP